MYCVTKTELGMLGGDVRQTDLECKKGQLLFLLHRSLEAASHLGGEDLEPFYTLLEGGRSGEFFAEMEEYFYYAQIKR